MDIPLSKIAGIGPARLKTFHAAGITTVRQLLMCFPREYRDMTQAKPLLSLRAGETATVRVHLASHISETRKGNMLISRARIEDDSSQIPAIWYNQPWIKQNFPEEQDILLYGRIENRNGKLQMTCPVIERGDGGIRPIYKPIGDIKSGIMAKCIGAALTAFEGQWPDELPESLRRRHGLCERNFAMRNAHVPESQEALAAARRRLSFEELLIYQVGLWIMRGTGEQGICIPCEPEDANKFWNLLPFPPTGAQRRVLEEIIGDLHSDAPMARMVQGDVGCGKTAIAFGALFLAVQNGWQGALMAPTEILAQQHYENATALFEPLGVKCGLLTGSMTAKQHREAHNALKEGEWQIAIGTHALITPGVEYKNLGLAITDEQHRFGVKQRTKLSAKGDSPNVLVMSATPIPRTLSLILYGDLDISIVDELPPGRTPVKTRIVPEEKRSGMYDFLRREVHAGRQVYIVCPLVEESEAVDALPAEAVYEDLRTRHLNDLRVGLAHGKMSAPEKERVLGEFYAGNLDILVSTTVIEVGVNVPNASVMVIENAERFGLSQLHQLRGRVGRGAAISWCFLMAQSNEKLKLMTETNDGFVIAQRDLELRGPGELFGYRQSGDAAGGGVMGGDTKILKEAHDAARSLLKSSGTEEAQQVIALARDVFRQKFTDIALN